MMYFVLWFWWPRGSGRGDSGFAFFVQTRAPTYIHTLARVYTMELP
jgi:hypothetical protein